MTTKIRKWGNSLAVRLPQRIVREYALREGSEVAVREEMKRIVIQKVLPQDKNLHKDAWKQFVIPVKKKKENVSEKLDHILYGISH